MHVSLRFYRKTLFVSLFVATVLSGCNKDDDDDLPADDENIAEYVARNDDFSTLEAAVNKAGLVPALSSPGPYTLFAPDNAAFTASGITSLDAYSATDLEHILAYHLLGSTVLAAGVPAGPNAKVITSQGDSIFTTSNSNGVYVNGVKVTEADIIVTNGVIHRINRVLVPPAGDIVETAQAPDSGLDSLVKAVLRVNNEAGGNPALVSILQSSILTVFAPSNMAFTNLMTTLGVNNINDIPLATLMSVLGYHVVPGRTFSSDLANGSLTMFASGNTTINLTNGINGGPTITGNGNGTDYSNINSANIMATNGVIHVIDRVLLP